MMDGTDYDLNKYMTLMFFLERLLEKGQPRSLHDLSCQFGSKGFTKTMRQIAGGSQSGLKKFLAQYPFLFSVDGDLVSITNMNLVDKCEEKSNNTRNYEAEAAEYFRKRVEQYGPGIEVPIKSLLGHRSQAPPEVRHISGQHMKEFRDFLLRHPHVFIVYEETTMLKEYEGMEKRPFEEAVNETKVNPELANKFLIYFRLTLEQSGPKHVDDLFQSVSSNYARETWSLLFKNPQDLCTFLRMHSNIFHIHANVVELLPNPTKLVNVQKTVSPSPLPKNTTSPPSSLQFYQSVPPPSALPVTAPVPSQQTLKQRVNSILLRTLAENTDRDRNSALPVNEPPSAPASPARDLSRVRVLGMSHVIVTVKESVSVVSEILNSGRPVAFDCEGVNLGVKGNVTLLQIATSSGRFYMFDLITCPDIMHHGMLAKLFDSDVIKVCHDCKNDCAALVTGWNVQVRNIFDTQAAYTVLQLQEHGKSVHKVKSTSLNALCELLNLPGNPCREQAKALYRRDPRFWARRPLTRDMVLYAAYDILPLLSLYEILDQQIKSEFLPLFAELVDENIHALLDPDRIKQRKKQRRLDYEVLELKQKLATTQAKSLVLSNREIRLLRHLQLTEEEKAKLEGSYKVAKKLERLQSKNDEKDGEDDDNDDDEPKSLDSLSESEHNSPDSSLHSSAANAVSPLSPNPIVPTSIATSMQMVDEVLSDPNIDRLEKLDRLEAILSSTCLTTPDTPHVPNVDWLEPRCCCRCHAESVKSDAESQTLSTGSVVITKVYSPAKDEGKTLLSSPKK